MMVRAAELCDNFMNTKRISMLSQIADLSSRIFIIKNVPLCDATRKCPAMTLLRKIRFLQDFYVCIYYVYLLDAQINFSLPC
jgi:hypothetical protein